VSGRFDAVIFDLGGVVLGWDPTRAFAEVLSPDQVEAFMTKIDFRSWNATHDAGQLFDVGEAELLGRFPDDERAIRAYRSNFARTLTGPVPGTGAVIAELQRSGVGLVALTNWSAETYPHAERRFGILRRFAGIVVSGTEGVAKPDPAIFLLACERFGLDPGRTVFVDDSAVNVTAAAAAGLTALAFVGAEALRRDLVGLGLLEAPQPVTEPVYHLAVAAEWSAGVEYPWSTREVSYDAEGYVHCAFAGQLAGVRDRYYADLADEELRVLELDLAPVPDLLIVEDLGAGEPYPHLYGPLTPALVSSVTPYAP
jgi:2-haloacid dehalogenase